MAQKVGGGRGGGPTRGGGGKSGQGPRQPAGRKYGSAGPVKTGPRGSGAGKTGGPGTGAARSGGAQWESRGPSTGAKRGTGGAGRPASGKPSWDKGPSRDDRAPRREVSDRPARHMDAKPASWDKGPGRPGRGADAGYVRGDAPRQPRRDTASSGSWDNRGPGRPARQGAPAGGSRSAGPRAEGRGREARPTRDERPRQQTRREDDRPARRESARPSGQWQERKPARAARPSYGKEPVRAREPRPAPAEEAAPKTRPFEGKSVAGLDWHTPELEGKVVGLNPVLELLRSGGRAIDTVFIDSAKGGKLFNDIMEAARAIGITIKMVPKEALDKMSPGLRHQGAVAVVSPKEYSDPDELVEAAFAKKAQPLFVLLDGVEDPQNLGSVIRTADAAGADGVFIPEHRAAHLSAAVSRASAGALEHVSVAKVKNLATFVGTLKKKGVWVVGLEAGSGKAYTGFNMDVPVALVLGSEGAGVRAVVKNACDEVVSLPMMGKVNSLNVSVAAGVMLYEVLRQRAKKQA